jgi:hypothetical protein
LSSLLAAQGFSITIIIIIPQPFAWLTAKQITWLGLGRQRHDFPTLAASLHFCDDAAGEVVLVPAGLDQDDPSARFQPGHKVRFVPVPGFLARMLGIGPGRLGQAEGRESL